MKEFLHSNKCIRSKLEDLKELQRTNGTKDFKNFLDFSEFKKFSGFGFFEKVDIIQAKDGDYGDADHEEIEIIPRIGKVITNAEPDDLNADVDDVDYVKHYIDVCHEIIET